MKQRIHSTMNDWPPFLAIPDAPAVNADTAHRFPARVITKLFHSAALLLAVCPLLSGCAGPVIATERIQIVAEPDANQSSATAVDLVFIYDQAALGVLPRTGPSWFASKEALMRGLATDIEVVPFEVPPGVQIDVSVPARSRSAIAVYSYANYLHPAGQAVGSLTSYRAIVIRLQRDRINYIAMP